MPHYEFLWTPESMEHATAHGVSIDEIEQIIKNPERTDVSRTTGHPMAFGYDEDGREIACVYQRIDDLLVCPITAFYID